MYQNIIPLMPKSSASSCATPILNTNGQIGTGASQAYEYPLYASGSEYGESAFIYTAANLAGLTGAGPKQIRGVGFYFRSYTLPYVYSNVEIWLAHTTNAEFPVGTTVGYSGMTITNLTKCDSASWTISTNNAFQFRAPFNISNFCYNGTDNLLVIVKNYSGSYGGVNAGACNYSTVVGNRGIWTSQFGSYPANGTAMTRVQRVSNILIYY